MPATRRYASTIRTGSLAGATGGRGTGPGEFPARVAVGRSLSCWGDSVLVPMNVQLAVYGAPGAYARTFQLTAPVGRGRFAAAIGCLGSRIIGKILLSPFATVPGIHRDTVALAWFDRDGRFGGMIDTLLDRDKTYISYPGAEGLGYHWTPFGRSLAIAVGEDAIATGNGDTFEIQVRDGAGAVRQIIRAAGRERPVTNDEIARYREFVAPRGNEHEQRQYQRELDGPDLPRTLPAFAELRFDAAGNLWVRAYDFADAVAFHDDRPSRPRTVRPENRRWTVFDRTGRLLGDVATPPRFDVHEIGEDWILGVWRDELDVEHVRLYGLLKPRA